MDSLVLGHHPLLLLIQDLKSSLSTFQDQAHSYAVKLQHHALSTSRTLDRAHALEHENHSLNDELVTLRSNPLPSSSTSQESINQLTLSLRNLNEKLTTTESQLSQRTTELSRVLDDLNKSQSSTDAAYELCSRIRSREEVLQSRQRELELKVQLSEERARMSERAVEEYADLVRTLQNQQQHQSQQGDLAVTCDGSIQRILHEFAQERENLQIQLSSAQHDLELVSSQNTALTQSSEDTLTQLTNLRMKLQLLERDDTTAAKMVSRYMKFSQTQTNALQTTLSTLTERHSATLSSLTAHIHTLSQTIHHLQSHNSRLLSAVDDLGNELLKESFGRRREVRLRIRLVRREESVLEGMKRWLRRSEERWVKSEKREDGENGEGNSYSREVLSEMIQDAKILIDSLDHPLPFSPPTTNGGVDELSTLITPPVSGSLARLITIQSVIDDLVSDVQREQARRIKAESLVLHEEIEQSRSPTVAAPLESQGHGRERELPPVPLTKTTAEVPDTTLQGVNNDNKRPDIPIATHEESLSPPPPAIPQGDDGSRSQSPPLPPPPCTPATAVDTLPPPVEPIVTIAPGVNDDGSLISEDGDTTKPASSSVTTAAPVPEEPIPDAADEVEEEEEEDNPWQFEEDADGVLPDDTVKETGIAVEEVAQIVEEEEEEHEEITTTDLEAKQMSIDPSPPSNVVPPTSLDTSASYLIHNGPRTPSEMNQPPSNDDASNVFPPVHAQPSSPTVPQLSFLSQSATTTSSIEPTTTPPPPIKPAPHPLLHELTKARNRYDQIQRSFHACHIALESLKTSLPSANTTSPNLLYPNPRYPLASIPSSNDKSHSSLGGSGDIPSDVLSAIVHRLDDYTEDARVELEIRISDEEVLGRGYEALLVLPGALQLQLSLPSSGGEMAILGDDTLAPGSINEVEAQIRAFIDGTDPVISRASKLFQRKLEDIEHDIVILKQAIHDPQSLTTTTPSPLPIPAPLPSSSAPTSSLIEPQDTAQSTDSSTSGGTSWTSWIRTPSRPTTPTPSSTSASSGGGGPIPTFGNIMTSRNRATLPAIRRTVSAYGLSASSPSTSSATGVSSLLPLSSSSSGPDIVKSLGLKVPMPDFTFALTSRSTLSSTNNTSSLAGGYTGITSEDTTLLGGNLGLGIGAFGGASGVPRSRTVSTMYMLGMGMPGAGRGKSPGMSPLSRCQVVPSVPAGNSVTDENGHVDKRGIDEDVD